MIRIAAVALDGRIVLSDGRSMFPSTAQTALVDQAIWVRDINTMPRALTSARLCDATTLSHVTGLPLPEGHALDELLAWVDSALDFIETDEGYDDMQLAIRQQRMWWRVLRHGFRIDPDALRDISRREKKARQRARTRLGTDLFVTDNARQFLDDHGIRIPPPDAEDGTPSAVTNKMWHRAEVPEGSEEAWAEFRRVRTEVAHHYAIKEVHDHAITGRAWTKWQVSGAKSTGRMSSHSVPMQNVPKPLRHVFLADEGHVLIKCDLDRAEPSVAAWLSGDEALARDLREGDVYQRLGERIGVDRATAKVVFLSLLYGKGIARLAFDLEITTDAAAQIKNDILDAYPDLARWMRRVTRNAKRDGGATTAFGRHLPLDEDESFKAVNYTAQGTAAGVLMRMVEKIAQHPLLGESSIWLAVHDEVILQVPVSDDYSDVLAAFAECMTFEPALGIRVSGNPEVLGTRWGSVA